MEEKNIVDVTFRILDKLENDPLKYNIGINFTGGLTFNYYETCQSIIVTATSNTAKYTTGYYLRLYNSQRLTNSITISEIEYLKLTARIKEVMKTAKKAALEEYCRFADDGPTLDESID
jgi:hypothetical protein